VRRLDIDGVAEVEARRGGGDLSEVDKRRWHEYNAMVGSPYIAAPRVRLMRS
jgi:hypothetical protein